MLNDIKSIVILASEIYKSAQDNLAIEEKGDKNNLVTQYDKMIQDYIVSQLKVLYPDATFLCEEGEDDKSCPKSGICFIIDPIDGTTNFIKGFEHSAISVGVTIDGELTCGVVYDVDKDNLYEASKSNGAFLNGKRIYVSNNDIEHSVVMFGTSPYNRELAHKTFEMAESIFQSALELRRSGSAALDICYVASGKADLYFELTISPWDWAGAYIILKEAGGTIGTVERGELDLNLKSSILVGNKKNIDEFINYTSLWDSTAYNEAVSKRMYFNTLY